MKIQTALPNRSHRTKTGYIYAISAPNGFVKIGQGASAIERFTMHQCSSPMPLALTYMCECPDPVGIEIAVHEDLRAFREHREWFRIRADAAIHAIRSALTKAGCSLSEVPVKRAKSNGKLYTVQVLVSESARR